MLFPDPDWSIPVPETPKSALEKGQLGREIIYDISVLFSRPTLILGITFEPFDRF